MEAEVSAAHPFIVSTLCRKGGEGRRLGCPGCCWVMVATGDGNQGRMWLGWLWTVGRVVAMHMWVLPIHHTGWPWGGARER